MTSRFLLEQCVACGRVIRDDRATVINPEGVRDRVTPHYHWRRDWIDASGPTLLVVHATVCAEHLPDLDFDAAWRATDARYTKPGSKNATLPKVSERILTDLDEHQDALARRVGGSDCRRFPGSTTIVAHWVAEEAEEMWRAARDIEPDGPKAEGPILDAALDALGILLAQLGLYSDEARRTAFNAFKQAQRARDRPPSHWERTMTRIIDVFEHDESTTLKESTSLFLSRFARLIQTERTVELSVPVVSIRAKNDPDYARRSAHLVPIAFIMAPSNSGKSFFVKSLAAEDYAVDGDAVIDATLGWPSATYAWWKTPIKESVHWSNFNSLCGYAAARNVPVIFNGKLYPRINMWYGLVKITRLEFERNARTRQNPVPAYAEYLDNHEKLDVMLTALTKADGSTYRKFTSFSSAVLSARGALPLRAPQLRPHPKDK